MQTNDNEPSLGESEWGRGYKTSSAPGNSRVHHHNTRATKDITAESSVHVVPRDTVMLDADDFTLPEFEPVPELELEFEDVELLVPELLPETVSWPEISGKRKGVCG